MEYCELEKEDRNMIFNMESISHISILKPDELLIKRRMNFKATLLFFILSFLLEVKINAQDSILIESQLSVETRGQHNLKFSDEKQKCINCTNGFVFDNPLYHLAIYSGIEHKLIFNKQYSIITGLYLEERSQSGGNNTLSNIVVFPKILIEVNDTIKFKNKKIVSHLKGGDFWDEEINDILRFYNIDYQGLIGKFTIGKLSLNFMSIGDLSRNIGLNLEQTYKLGVGYNISSNLMNDLSITLNELYNAESDYNVSNYMKLDLKNGISFEGQSDIRLTRSKRNPLALGLKFNYNKPKFQITTSFKYYNAEFNVNYDGYIPNYSENGKYVGPQLYPLKNFYRNYSQWAVYTHYPGYDLIAAEIRSKYNCNLYKKIGGFYELDINYIYELNKNKSNLIPIYNCGMKINYTKFFEATIALTNKHMELRRPYQTFAVSNTPSISLGVNMKMEGIKLKTYRVGN